jgi:hypothetical protein
MVKVSAALPVETALWLRERALQLNVTESWLVRTLVESAQAQQAKANSEQRQREPTASNTHTQR